ncbi:hypothetical protein J1N35_003517 [Gossypium stocksii]|uniref:Uncharacterized protein n=1 Tax=Gossypium stocksii TaxID=47602 RepID=A0A9D3WAD9_9ROSI|nr:hypothetical protein J1N35_003517 [Gossypium stocksii]
MRASIDEQLNQQWVTLTYGTLTRKPTALDLAPAVCAATPMPLLGSMGSCVADSASVAMPRKSDSSSTAEEFIWSELGRTLFKHESLCDGPVNFLASHVILFWVKIRYKSLYSSQI